MTFRSIHIATVAILAAGVLVSAWPGEDAGAQGVRPDVLKNNPVHAVSVRTLQPAYGLPGKLTVIPRTVHTVYEDPCDPNNKANNLFDCIR